MKFSGSAVVALLVLLATTSANAQEPYDSPIRAGRYSISGGGGFSNDSFSIAAGVGYFVVDGLLPGVRYQYTRITADDADANESHHNLNVYLRYYLFGAGGFYPFVVADAGYLKIQQWGSEIDSGTAELYSVMGGAGAALYLSRHFYVDFVAGMRHYIDPPVWSDFDAEPDQFEWGLGFGAAF